MTSCLIVDDSRVIRNVARRILEELEFEVREAADGKQALAACAEAMPEVVLLDWNMPVMDGLEFLKALRAGDYETQPKVIFCTTVSDFEHIQMALDAGADEYIMKPFDSDIVRSKLAQVGVIA